MFWGAFNTALEIDQHRAVLHLVPRDGRQRLSRNSPGPFISPTAQASERPALTAMSRTTGRIRSPARCKLRRKCGARSSARSTRGGSSSITASNWHSTNGHASRPMTVWNAATVTLDGHGSVKADKQRGEIHTRFLFSGKATCIDCHKGIAHELPNMEGVDPGWKVPPELSAPPQAALERQEFLAWLNKKRD